MSKNITKTECITNYELPFISADTIYMAIGAWLSYMRASLPNRYDRAGIGSTLGAVMVTAGVVLCKLKL